MARFVANYYPVVHLHDGVPPLELTKPVFRDGKSDYSFHRDKKVNPKKYKVIFIYRDPVVARLSRGTMQHCINIDGDSDNYKEDLVEYVKYGHDTMRYSDHFDAYTRSSNKNYSVLCVNFNRMWDFVSELLVALDIPQAEAHNFPVKRDSNYNVDDAILSDLRDMYSELNEKIRLMPPIHLVENNGGSH